MDDPNSTLTIQIENDSTRSNSDDYYTSGERIAYTSPPGRSGRRSPLWAIRFWETGSNASRSTCRN